ncbi:hypothetical protein HMN09_00980500 [Mycena chlorophos]|uniref:Yeast cell wall synthesis Kre9/Knh1-like N-terminal domain-containing protein n=1 Tax=Mycena chlorophos TaxID=658473 RepID=A0A8H6W1P9_MYCCL|nr:hypothetical protein HMN09_00980500 [Mycena chlorophos]
MLAMAKLGAFLALAAPFTSALEITSITGNFVIGGVIVVNWTTNAATDPSSFSIEMLNPTFNNQYALGNNVPTSDMSKSIEMPVVVLGQGNYQIEFIDIENINTVFTISDNFTIGAENTTTTNSVGGKTIKTTATPISTPSTTSAPATTAATTTPLDGNSTPADTTPAATSSSPATSSPAGSSAGMPFAVASYFAGSAPGAILALVGLVAGALAL